MIRKYNERQALIISGVVFDVSDIKSMELSTNNTELIIFFKNNHFRKFLIDNKSKEAKRIMSLYKSTFGKIHE